MKNSFYQAKLISLRKISVLVMTSLPFHEKTNFLFTKEDSDNIVLKITKRVSMNETNIFELELPFDYPFGSACYIFLENLGRTPVDVSNVVEFSEFDSLFNYEKDDLGANYTKKETTFKLWAPLASLALLKLENKDGEFDLFHMKRGEKGVYSLTIKGDLLNRKYNYVINNSGVLGETSDPFGRGASFNSKFSAVIDIDSIKKMKRIKCENQIRSSLDAIIYEAHIRDFTANIHTDISAKGKYLGLIEENKKTTGGHPAGLDYLKYLGITHLQLQPIHDFKGNDNPDYNKEYNWGYDPINYFALEGSYSLKPEIPMERIKEFRKVVDTLHKNNIRVIIDVVYNHVFDYFKTAYERSVPNYFFRKTKNGTIANASGCGDDFASEKYMARKVILESVKMLFEVYDVDGLRFDLMGLIDIPTMKEVLKIAKTYKKDALIYGEGWNMGYELPFEMKACLDNADKLEGIGFFNDSYRDILKGPTFQDKIKDKGYINGDLSYSWGFQFAYMGSATNYTFPARFKKASQSLNYLECHDNNTLFDKLSYSNPEEDKDTLLNRIKLGNALVLLSIGFPFIHMGQEIGKSKYGLDNTYNTPRVNDLDYSEVDARFAMVNHLRSLIHLRNNELSFLKDLDDSEDIKRTVSFTQKEDGLLIISLKPERSEYKEVKILVNITGEIIQYDLEEYHQMIFADGGIIHREDLNIKCGSVSPRSLQVLTLK